MQLSGKRTYIITTRRMTSGDELKRLNGLSGLTLDLRLIAVNSHLASAAATLV